MIQLSNCSIDEFDICSVKPFNFLWIHRLVSREITMKELNEIFQSGAYLQLYDEYYSYGEFLWRCAIYPYNTNKKSVKKYGTIEINGFTESPLEYYLEK